MDGRRFDGLVRDIATMPRARRTVLAGLFVGLLGGVVTAPVAHEAVAGANCGKGRKPCHGKCCPRNAPVCCPKGCCNKGEFCVGNDLCGKN